MRWLQRLGRLDRALAQLFLERLRPDEPPPPKYLQVGDSFYPKGRIVELLGCSSRTAELCLRALASARPAGALLDPTGMIGAAQARSAGADPARLLLGRPQALSAALELALALIEQRSLGALAITSADLLQPDASAQKLSIELRKLAGALAKTEAILLIAHEGDRGALSECLRFYASKRLWLKDETVMVL